MSAGGTILKGLFVVTLTAGIVWGVGLVTSQPRITESVTVCPDGAEIFGYHVPNMLEYGIAMNERRVRLSGDEPDAFTGLLNNAFLRDVMVRGIGVTSSGTLLSYQNGEWFETANDDPTISENAVREERYMVHVSLRLQNDAGMIESPFPFTQAFLDEVAKARWGRLRENVFIGYRARLTAVDWSSRREPLAFDSTELKIGSAATDPHIIPRGSTFRIPDLPEPFNTVVFRSSDVRSGIINCRVAVFTGIGSAAEIIARDLNGTRHAIEVVELAPFQ